MESGKVVGALLTGVAVGAVLGALLTSEKGKDLIKKIVELESDGFNTIKDLISDFKGNISDSGTSNPPL
ncbi:YtxH-like protein [Flavobacterium flevense]|uniref:YtxH domain-containing protein n=1 Tax=Flavobacterium flevense TaxID=983 RepID=A0A4Y4AT51_9FLAO|nr:YtxH domain-containing protein [Flavobacterium flevense]GEC71408.1 hypothetical protein FFL01_09470 [Flavobacterium flevense]SHL79451.1 YtxH-like protein [Flavobacterium flevense]